MKPFSFGEHKRFLLKKNINSYLLASSVQYNTEFGLLFLFLV